MRRRALHFQKSSAAPVTIIPNTFIGGIAPTYSTAALLASQLGIAENDITYFAISGVDIYARIEVNYSIGANTFNTDPNITEYEDFDGKATFLGNQAFYNADKLGFVYFPSATSIGWRCFASCKIFSKAIIPNATNLGGTVGDDTVFTASNTIQKIYCHASLETNNGGNPDGDLAVAISQGATVTYVQNYTPPSVITDLSIGTAYATAVELNFTPPASINAIEYYEVYVDGVINSRYAAGSEVMAIGFNPSSNTGNISVVAVDEFYNKSSFSNTVSASTNSTYVEDGATEIFSFRRKRAGAINAVRISRSSDNAETDILLPSNYKDFISLSSTVSAGGTLGSWIGSNDGIVKIIYGQIGFKNLSYTNVDYKLITAGVLNRANGKPAIIGNTTTGNGLESIGLNGGVSLTNASIFAAIRNNDIAVTNRIVGFGNYNKDGNGTGKIHWNPTADNSLRFDGAAINTPLVAASAGSKIRASFKNGNTYSDYINGMENIVPTILSGTNTIDDFYVGIHNAQNFNFSEAVIFLSDESLNKGPIESEMIGVYKIF